jgi:hypothetical protein
VRRLLFSNEELVAAISEHNQRSGKKLPTGAVVACKPLGRPELMVRMDIFEQRSGETRTIDLTPEVVGAALLRYCMSHRIPIPKNAEKSVQVQGDDIVLNIEIKADSQDIAADGGPPDEA